MNKTYFKTTNQGFTLIEMLVVLAIIGIVVSFALVNLKSSRAASIDNRIKTFLAEATLQSKLYVDSTSYIPGNSICMAPAGMKPSLLRAAQLLSPTNTISTTSIFTYNPNGGPDSAVCVDNGTPYGWAAIVSLKSPSTQNAGWCVDSTGTAKESTSISVRTGNPTQYSCP